MLTVSQKFFIISEMHKAVNLPTDYCVSSRVCGTPMSICLLRTCNHYQCWSAVYFSGFRIWACKSAHGGQTNLCHHRDINAYFYFYNDRWRLNRSIL